MTLMIEALKIIVLSCQISNGSYFHISYVHHLNCVELRKNCFNTYTKNDIRPNWIYKSLDTCIAKR